MKLKNTLKGFGKYFREVSVVIVGIAITFTLSDWIGSRNERKDLERYLDAVKMELEGNLKIVEKEIAYFHQGKELARYLASHKSGEVRLDSIEKYNRDSYGSRIIQNTHIFPYKKTAFEMFKVSGDMRLLNDKALLTAIWDTYDQLEEMKNDHDGYMKRKEDELFNLLLTSDAGELTIGVPEAKRYRTFLMLNADLDESYRNCHSQILKTLSAFDLKQ